jgi:hypothetical protein
MNRTLLIPSSFIAGLVCSFVSAADRLVPRQFPTIQAAINAAGAGDNILISPGVYAEKLTIQKQVHLVGIDGPAVTAIDGDGFSGSLVVVGSDGAQTTLDGLTIRNGSSTGLSIGAKIFQATNCVLENNQGPGASLGTNGPGSVSFDSCTFSGNQSSSGGGFSQMLTGNSPIPVSFTQCSFIGNIATNDGGGASVRSATFSGCVFENNDAGADVDDLDEVGRGGAIMIGGFGTLAGTATIQNCEFTGNTNSAIWVGTGFSNPQSTATVTGCAFTSNVGPFGGGIWINSGDASVCSLSGSTICDNQADNIDGAFLDEGGNAVCPSEPDADLNGDGVIDGGDLGLLLANWGTNKLSAAEDLNNDGDVNGADLSILLAAWSE